MLEAKKNSPLLQPDERHINARYYALRAPDGTVYRGRNINHFVREHSWFFDPDDLCERYKRTTRAALGLSALRPTRKNQLPSWKGWTWARDDE